ncbi:MAG: exodeoxyribonuclease I, partial [Candidatus Saccharimonadales bacterium]
MPGNFFFYDLETSGFSPRSARIMQFAGQRTDMELKPIGEPVNVLVKLAPDVLPEPDAVLITSITPQQTLAEGLTEAEFLKLFYEEVVRPDTIFVGFNSIRFDDEFMRFLHYRNFYDAYEWQWRDGCSRWDVLDVVRMTRALRPDGIEWPFAPDGKPANRLEFLTQVNKLEHSSAHDALSDVTATIAVAKLVRDKQQDLFEYLLKLRDKKKVAELVQTGRPFVYTSGRYSSQYLHTTAAVMLAKHPQQDAALVYDLRYDPTPFIAMDIDELVAAWRFTKDPDAPQLPAKTLKYNRSPAVAPLGVIKDEAVQERLELPLELVAHHQAILKKHQAAFSEKVLQAVSLLDEERARAQTALVDNALTVDERLYDGFIDKADATRMRVIRAAAPEELSQVGGGLRDRRLQNLLPLYKARNYPKALDGAERAAWDKFCHEKLLAGGTESRLAKYFARLQELATNKLTGQQQYLLEEL